jgi:putative NADH-flavin reductase
MKISLFGASGATGLLLTERCLVAGHEVTALVRTPERFRFRDRVRVVRGDAFTPAAIAETVRGADAVLSALGARSLGNEGVLERAVPLIVTAMQEAGVRRIVALGSSGALESGLDKQPGYRRWLIETVVYPTLMKWPVASQRAQYGALSASGLDWTMALPPMLMNLPGRGRYRVDGEALPRNGVWIARSDVADFMMEQLGSEEWVGRGVYLCY